MKREGIPAVLSSVISLLLKQVFWLNALSLDLNRFSRLFIMYKKSLSERDICTKFITPALKKAGWDIQKQVREEVFFTDGRIIVQG
jgi:AAA+ superfamily predicted ATPase